MILGRRRISPGMEKTWKFGSGAGGGCLMDPGIHLLDLINVINDFKEMSVVGASAWQGFWKTGIEEEAHVLLRSTTGFSAKLQTSIVRWRSVFQLEIHGEFRLRDRKWAQSQLWRTNLCSRSALGLAKGQGPGCSGGVGSKK